MRMEDERTQSDHELALAEYDAWNAMTDKERDHKIKWSLR